MTEGQKAQLKATIWVIVILGLVLATLSLGFFVHFGAFEPDIVEYSSFRGFRKVSVESEGLIPLTEPEQSKKNLCEAGIQLYCGGFNPNIQQLTKVGIPIPTLGDFTPVHPKHNTL